MKIRFRCEIPVYKKLSFTDSGYNLNPTQGLFIAPIFLNFSSFITCHIRSG